MAQDMSTLPTISSYQPPANASVLPKTPLIPNPRGVALNQQSIQGRANEIGTPNPSGFVPHLPTVYGPDQSSVPFSVTNGVGSSTNSNGLPTMAQAAEQPVAQAPAAAPQALPAIAPVVAATAAKPAAVNPTQAIIDWANSAPTSEQKGTRLMLATHMMTAEAAQTQALTGKNAASLTPHEIGQRQEIDPLTGMSTRNENIYGTYNPDTKGWDPIKLPTIDKAALKEGATGKDKAGRSTVVKNGQWVAA